MIKEFFFFLVIKEQKFFSSFEILTKTKKKAKKRIIKTFLNKKTFNGLSQIVVAKDLESLS